MLDYAHANGVERGVRADARARDQPGRRPGLAGAAGEADATASAGCGAHAHGQGGDGRAPGGDGLPRAAHRAHVSRPRLSQLLRTAEDARVHHHRARARDGHVAHRRRSATASATRSPATVSRRATSWCRFDSGSSSSRSCTPSRHAGSCGRSSAIDATTPLIGIVARLVPIKAHETFFEAARIVHSAACPTRAFWYLGDGERRAELESLVRRLNLTEAVRFLGWRHDMLRIYADLDVVALSSLQRGLTRVVDRGARRGSPGGRNRRGRRTRSRRRRRDGPDGSERRTRARWREAMLSLLERSNTRRAAGAGGAAARLPALRFQPSGRRYAHAVPARADRPWAALEKRRRGRRRVRCALDHRRGGLHRLASRRAPGRTRRPGAGPRRSVDWPAREPGRTRSAARFEFCRGIGARSRPLVEELVERADVVYHLAAAVGVDWVLRHPLRSLETNVHGTEIVLRACAPDAQTRVDRLDLRGVRQERQGGPQRGRRSPAGLGAPVALVLRRCQVDRRGVRARVLPGARAAGHGGAPVQHGRPATDRAVWHGRAAIR